MPPKRSKASSFPAARIKRIMQQDDDVGKVAGASPTVMSKAIELFLQEMMQAMEAEAKAKGTKRISLYHLKRAVENTPSLDFLKDMVSDIPDPVGADGDDDDAPAKKKPRAPKKANGEAKSTGKGSAKQSKTQVKTEPQEAAAEAGPSTSAVAIPVSSLLGNAGESAAATPSEAKPDASADTGPSAPKLEDEASSTAQTADAEMTQESKPAAEPAAPSERPDLQEDEDYD